MVPVEYSTVSHPSLLFHQAAFSMRVLIFAVRMFDQAGRQNVTTTTFSQWVKLKKCVFRQHQTACPLQTDILRF